jgi:hypothetical protein
MNFDPCYLDSEVYARTGVPYWSPLLPPFPAAPGAQSQSSSEVVHSDPPALAPEKSVEPNMSRPAFHSLIGQRPTSPSLPSIPRAIRLQQISEEAVWNLLLQRYAAGRNQGYRAREYMYFHAVAPSNAVGSCDTWVLLDVKGNVLPDNLKLGPQDPIALQDVVPNPLDKKYALPSLPTVFGHLGSVIRRERGYHIRHFHIHLNAEYYDYTPAHHTYIAVPDKYTPIIEFYRTLTPASVGQVVDEETGIVHPPQHWWEWFENEGCEDGEIVEVASHAMEA